MTNRRLSLLQQHDESLKKCVYCPKLCRAACSVAVVTANESLTPWGKMSFAYFQGRGDLATSEDLAQTAWACSNCFACEERCDHDHRVADVLSDARAFLAAEGVAPEPVKRVVASASTRDRQYQEALATLEEKRPSSPQGQKAALMIGCSYARHFPEVAEDICQVSEELLGAVRLQPGCCGLPLLDAGEPELFKQHVQALQEDLADDERLVVADPGCARTLRQTVPRLFPDLELPTIVPLVDVIYANIERLPPAVMQGRVFGYQDPCQLGRGLGRYEEPRAILARLSGEVPREMMRNRQHAECSGGGGLLPVSYPEASTKMAEERMAEQGLRGGELVTACAQSLKRYRSRGANAVDLVSLVAEAWRQRDET